MGFLPGIAAFTAAVLGGIGSIRGAALGGFVARASLESMGPFLLLSGFNVPSPFELRGVITFSILVLVLDLPARRPAGHGRGGEGVMHARGIKGAVRVGRHRRHRRVWFLALVGMIERLTDLSIIGDSLTMDQILIFLPAALAGLGRRAASGDRRRAVRRRRAGSATGCRGRRRARHRSAWSRPVSLVNLIGVESVRAVFIAISPTT